MFHFAFGHLMTGEPAFEPIPVAVADGAAYQSNFALRQMLEAVSADGENQLLRLTVVDREQAERMLAAGEVVGVILPGEGSDTGDATSVSLMVTQSGIRQSILKALSTSTAFVCDGVKHRGRQSGGPIRPHRRGGASYTSRCLQRRPA